MLSDRRARQQGRELQRRARGPQAQEVGEPVEGNRWTFDVSRLDGNDMLDGGGAFMFDHSRLDHLDGLRGGDRAAAGSWRFDHSRLDAEDGLEA